ncbi:hypothetical protein NL676_034966 [Syzygium grande]|nr:hypothetical protein NL676_034966 [Syzygium grande]
MVQGCTPVTGSLTVPSFPGSVTIHKQALRVTWGCCKTRETKRAEPGLSYVMAQSKQFQSALAQRQRRAKDPRAQARQRLPLPRRGEGSPRLASVERGTLASPRRGDGCPLVGGEWAACRHQARVALASVGLHLPALGEGPSHGRGEGYLDASAWAGEGPRPPIAQRRRAALARPSKGKHSPCLGGV